MNLADEEEQRDRDGMLMGNRSEMEGGERWWRALKLSSSVLKVMRWQMGSQWLDQLEIWRNLRVKTRERLR